MSTLTLWLAASALVIFVLVIALQIAYRRRVDVSQRPRPRRKGLKEPLSTTEAIVSTIPTIGLMVCLVVPQVAPTSALGVWLIEPYSSIVLIAWSFIASIILFVSIKVVARTRLKR